MTVIDDDEPTYNGTAWNCMNECDALAGELDGNSKTACSYFQYLTPTYPAALTVCVAFYKEQYQVNAVFSAGQAGYCWLYD